MAKSIELLAHNALEEITGAGAQAVVIIALDDTGTMRRFERGFEQDTPKLKGLPPIIPMPVLDVPNGEGE